MYRHKRNLDKFKDKWRFAHEERAAILIQNFMRDKIQERIYKSQLIFEKYRNHCATLIEKHVRGYLVRKEMSEDIERTSRYVHLRRALVKGWKIRKIISCKKIKTLIQQLKDMNNMCNQLLQETGKTNLTFYSSDAYSINMYSQLKMQRPRKVEEFVRMINILYLTGQWVYSITRHLTLTKQPKIIKQFNASEVILDLILKLLLEFNWTN